MKHFLIFLVRGYQLVLSPFLKALAGGGECCRFEPTCSVYAIAALRAHGALRGSWLAVRRICRCHPWGGSGLDPVPPPEPAGRGSPGAEVSLRANDSSAESATSATSAIPR